MAYKYITKYNSPNYTPKSQTRAIWGVDRKIKYICIHWWGDPKDKPTFSGVVNYLCRKGGNTSAHLIATGTGRQVACIVNFFDNAWACMSGNPYTINIECDPRCRDEDYDVVAEVIADLRQHYGNLPLKPHKYWVNTSCPGKYNLAKLDRLAKTKIANNTMGDVHDKVKPTPQPTPTPVEKPVEPKPPVKDQQVHEDPAVAQQALDQAKANEALLKQILQAVMQLISKFTSVFK